MTITTTITTTTMTPPHHKKLKGSKIDLINDMGMIKRYHAKPSSFSLNLVILDFIMIMGKKFGS
jgi:hypothetical protein